MKTLYIKFFNILTLILLLSTTGCSLVAELNDISSDAQINAKELQITAPKPEYINSPTYVQAKFAVDQPDFQLSDLTVVNATLSELTGGPQYYRFLITPDQEGILQLSSVHYEVDETSDPDAIENLFQLTYDNTIPIITQVQLNQPSTSPSNATTIQVQVGGVSAGDYIEIFTDPTCTQKVASQTSSGSQVLVTHQVFVSQAYQFYSRATDRAGNISTCSSLYTDYELDLLPPANTSLSITLQTPASSPSTDRRPQILVTGIDSAPYVYLYKDASCSQLYSSQTSNLTSALLSSSTDLADGAYEFHVRLADDVGNYSNCSTQSLTYVVDNVAPALITSLILQNPTSSPGSDSTPTIRVSPTAVGDIVKLYTNNTCSTEVASNTASGGTIDLTSSVLTEGTYQFYARSQDATGNTNACSTATVQYVLDTTAPNTPSALTLQSPSSSPNLDTTPTIRVSGVVSTDIVKLFSNNTCSVEVASGTSSGSTIDLTSSTMTDGTYTLYARSQDLAGNTSSCSTAFVNYVLDTQAPAAPTSLALQSPLTSPADDNTPTIRVSGVVSGDTVRLFTNNTCTTEVASGTAAASTIDLTSSTLTQGTYQFYARSTDSVGNVSTCSTATVTYQLDLATPSLPTSVTLFSPSSSPSQDATPTIRVSGITSGDTIKLFSGSGCSTQIASGVAGSTQIDLTTSSLSEGTYQIYLELIQPNTATTGCVNSSLSYTVDQTAPAVPSALALQTPSSSPDDDNTPTIRVSGVESGDVVKLFTNNTCSTQIASATASGTTVDLTTSVLTDASYNFYATSEDAAGNVSSCSTTTVSYVLDSTAPSIPSALALQGPAFSPASDTTPTIRVSGVVSGDTVKLFTDNTCSTEVSSGTSAGATIDLTTSTLTDGSYNFYATSQDSVGNTSNCSTATVAYVLDSVAPSVPSALTLQNPVVSPANDTTPTIRVSGVASGDTVKLFTDNTCSTEIASGTAGGATIDLTSSVLSEGSYSLYARSQDSAGNQSACSTASVAYVLDTTAPSAPSALTLQNPASSPNLDTTPTIRVSGVVSGDTVKLYTNNTCSTEVASDVAGAALIDLTSSVLSDGTHQFYARSTDPAGNNSSCSAATVSYVLDTAQPTATLSSAESSPTSALVISTTLTFNESVTGLNAGDFSLTNAYIKSLSGSGTTYTVEIIPLVEGTISISVPVGSAYDAAGNGNTVSNTLSWTFAASGTFYKQQAYVKPGNVNDWTQFGTSVAIDGDFLAVGSYAEQSGYTGVFNGSTIPAGGYDYDSGAVYVYKRSGVNWIQDAYIKSTIPYESQWFGNSLDLHGNTLAVGVLQEHNLAVTTIWNGTTPVEERLSDNVGAVYVYARTQSGWAMESYIKAAHQRWYYYFSYDISLYDNTLVVSTIDDESNTTTILSGENTAKDNSLTDVGAVYVYRRANGVWQQEAYIKASNAGQGDIFGQSVSLYKDTLVVSAMSEDSSATGVTNGATSSLDNSSADSGAVYVYVRNNSIWTQQAYIKAGNSEAGDFFGSSVSVFEDTLAVGAKREDSNQSTISNNATSSVDNSAINSGAVYIYKRTGVNWAQEAYIKAKNPFDNNEFGHEVVLQKDRLAVAAPNERSNSKLILNGENVDYDTSLANAGAVYVYERSGTSWSQVSYIKASNTLLDGYFGWHLDMDGATLVVSEPGDSSNQNSITNGSTSSTNTSLQLSGAAFVYSLKNTTAHFNTGRIAEASSNTNIQIDVGGSDITQYRYKFGPIGSTDCTDLTGYSSQILTTTQITEDISGLPDGEYILCLLGVNSLSQEQSVTTPSTMTWFKDTTAPTVVSTLDDNALNWKFPAISPNLTWSASSDSGSGILRYEVSFGTSAGATDLQTWRSAGTGTSFQFSEINFGYQSSVYANIRVVDKAGNISAVTSSDGYAIICDLADGWCPSETILSVNNESGDRFGGVSSAVSYDTMAVGVTGEDSGDTTITNGSTAPSDNTKVTSGAVYVYRFDGTNWLQEAYIKASNSDAGDAFGTRVSLKGDTLAVSAPLEDSSQTTILNSSDPASTNNSLSGSGAVYVYQRSGTTWVQQAYIKANNANADDGLRSVSLGEDLIAVGALGEDSNQTTITITGGTNNSNSGSGAVYIFRRNNSTWSQEAYIKAANNGATDAFGMDVSLSGDTLAVSGYLEDSDQTGITNGTGTSASNLMGNSGAVYIYRRSGTSWVQEAYIKAPQLKTSLQFGETLSLNGNTLVVGTSGEASTQNYITNGVGAAVNSTSFNAGAAYVYVRSGSIWSQQAFIKPSNAQARDFFGAKVSLHGHVLVVTAPEEESKQKHVTHGSTASTDDSLSDRGAIYVFRRAGTNWSQEAYIKSQTSVAGTKFGTNMTSTADRIFVGTDNQEGLHSFTYGPGFSYSKRHTQVKVDYSHIRAGQNLNLIVEYSDDGSSWTSVSTKSLVVNARHTYTLAWDDVGQHRYWRLRFVDPGDNNIGGSDLLYDVTWYQLDDKKNLPSIATRGTSNFTTSENAEDENNTTAATWDGSATGVIEWDFGP